MSFGAPFAFWTGRGIYFFLGFCEKQIPRFARDDKLVVKIAGSKAVASHPSKLRTSRTPKSRDVTKDSGFTGQRRIRS